MAKERLQKIVARAGVASRRAAEELILSGRVRVNGARIEASSRLVRIGDVITVALERTVRVLKVRGFVERRGPAKTCDGLYEDLG